MKNGLCLLVLFVLIFTLCSCGDKDELIEKGSNEVTSTNIEEVKNNDIYLKYKDDFIDASVVTDEISENNPHLWSIINDTQGITLIGVNSEKNEALFNFLYGLKEVKDSEFRDTVRSSEADIEKILGQDLILYIPDLTINVEDNLNEVDIQDRNIVVDEIFKTNDEKIEFMISRNGYEQQINIVTMTRLNSEDDCRKFIDYLFDCYKLNYKNHNGVSGLIEQFLKGELRNLSIKINVNDLENSKENGIIVANFLCDNLEGDLRVDINWEYYIPIN